MVTLLAGERHKRESGRAIQACNDYLRMGPGRSLRDLCRNYNEGERTIAPTRAFGTLANWSTRYGWQKRASEYDARLEQEKNERAQEIMESGLALEHKRVEKLKELAGFLWDQIQELSEDESHHRVWLPDVKQIGAGDKAERVDIERFNAALISEYRSALDDLAKETGGRKQRHEHAGPGGGDMRLVILPTKRSDGD